MLQHELKVKCVCKYLIQLIGEYPTK